MHDWQLQQKVNFDAQCDTFSGTTVIMFVGNVVDRQEFHILASSQNIIFKVQLRYCLFVCPDIIIYCHRRHVFLFVNP